MEGIKELIKARGKEKGAVVQKYKDDEFFTKFLYYALNPMMTYKISENTLRNTVGSCDYARKNFPGDTNYACKDFSPNDTWTSIFEICEYLNSIKASTNALTSRVVKFLLNVEDEDERNLYIGLLSKTIRLGVTNTTVNKIIPNLIPEWEVQQAYPIDKYPIKDGTWFTLTQKLNGVRATYYKGKMYARSGIPYEGLEHITAILDQYPNTVFDGELTLADNIKGNMSDNEAFRMATGIINSESKTKIEIHFTIFDIVDEKGFELGKSCHTYNQRRIIMNNDTKFLGLKKLNIPVSILPSLYEGTDQTMIDKLLDKMVAEDKEGLMVNLDVPYQRKRHRGILKVKRFYTMDLPIVDILEGEGRLIDTLGALVVDYKGNTVNVGTGFDDTTRNEIWAHREDYIGRICEVKYKEISSDKKTGEESLQFPVFVGIRFDKNSESFS